MKQRTNRPLGVLAGKPVMDEKQLLLSHLQVFGLPLRGRGLCHPLTGPKRNLKGAPATSGARSLSRVPASTQQEPMSFETMMAAWATPCASPTQKLVLATVASFTDKKSWESYPSIQTMAKRCQLSVRTIKTELQRLQKAGLIQVKRTGRTSRYRVLPGCTSEVQSYCTSEVQSTAPPYSTRVREGKEKGTLLSAEQREQAKERYLAFKAGHFLLHSLEPGGGHWRSPEHQSKAEQLLRAWKGVGYAKT